MPDLVEKVSEFVDIVPFADVSKEESASNRLVIHS